MKIRNNPKANSALIKAISDAITNYASFEKIRNYATLDQFVTDPNTIYLNAVALPRCKNYINAFRQIPSYVDNRPTPAEAHEVLNRGLAVTALKYSLETQATVGAGDTCVMSISFTPCTNTIQFDPTNLYCLDHHEVLCICNFTVNPYQYSATANGKLNNPGWLDNFNSELGLTDDKVIVSVDGTYPCPNCIMYTDADRKESTPAGSHQLHYWGDFEEELNNTVEMLFRPFYHLVIRSLGFEDMACGKIGCCGFFMGKSLNPKYSTTNVVPQVFDFTVVGALGRA